MKEMAEIRLRLDTTGNRVFMWPPILSWCEGLEDTINRGFDLEQRGQYKECIEIYKDIPAALLEKYGTMLFEEYLIPRVRNLCLSLERARFNDFAPEVTTRLQVKLLKDLMSLGG